MDQSIVEKPQASAADGAGRLDVRVTGMSCAACVRRVERAAVAVPGVGAVVVNLATERAAIVTGPTFQMPTLVSALTKAGYPPVEEVVDGSVKNLGRYAASWNAW